MKGTAYLFPLPFWIYVAQDDPPQVEDAVVGDLKLRLYPPFRSGLRTVMGTSYHIEADVVPFRPGRRPPTGWGIRPALLPIPQLGGSSFSVIMPRMDGTVADHLAASLPPDAIRIDAYKPGTPIAGGRIRALQEQLITLLRWRTGQWWLTRSMDGLVGPVQLNFPVDGAGGVRAVRKKVEGVTRARTLSGSERPLDNQIWIQAIHELQQDMEVPIVDVLLLDAQYFLARGELREAVLNAASACDHLKEQVFRELWIERNPGKEYDDARRNDVLRGWDLPRHLDEKFRNHFRRSYRVEHPEPWGQVNDLWQARNNVAHGAANEFGDPATPVDEEVAKGMLRAAEHCVAWLKGLVAPAG